LAGDIGGTHARLALCEVDGTSVRRDVQAVYDSLRFESLADIARAFVGDHEVDVESACFGVPGPVAGRRAVATNLPWEIDADDLERNLGIPSIFLINDLEATAHGLATLAEADFRELRPGASGVTGNAGLVAAGTGLGEAGMFWDGRRHRPFACEGGHTDFAPSDDREAGLLAFLRAKYRGHVSWERVVSGRGLLNIYEFLKVQDPAAEPSWLAEELAGDDPPPVITRHAKEERSELCHDAVAWFLALYGAEAGNLALKVLATGGIYLGGGIAPKLVDLLPDSQFVARFEGKGRMKRVLERIGIRTVTNDRAALQGAALYAHQRSRGESV
jgi:glucokinase